MKRQPIKFPKIVITPRDTKVTFRTFESLEKTVEALNYRINYLPNDLDEDDVDLLEQCTNFYEYCKLYGYFNENDLVYHEGTYKDDTSI